LLLFSYFFSLLIALQPSSQIVVSIVQSHLNTDALLHMSNNDLCDFLCHMFEHPHFVSRLLTYTLLPSFPMRLSVVSRATCLVISPSGFSHQAFLMGGQSCKVHICDCFELKLKYCGVDPPSFWEKLIHSLGAG
jgi:hypothetical protein